MELSIDTSNKYVSIALSEKGKIIIDKTWISNKNHSVELLPAIQTIIKSINKNFQNIQCIFIASGPGRFSALRVGMSVAKGLAIGLNIPISAINTLYLEAYPELIQNIETNALIQYNKELYLNMIFVLISFVAGLFSEPKDLFDMFMNMRKLCKENQCELIEVLPDYDIVELFTKLDSYLN